MNPSSILQLVRMIGGVSMQSGLLRWTDAISGMSLLVLALVVLFEYAWTMERDIVIKKKSFVAVFVMGVFLATGFVLGREGIGKVVMSLKSSEFMAVVGCAFVCLGVVSNIMARLQLGSNWSNSIILYKDQKIIDKGFYGIVRHPLYATIFLIALGLAIMYQNYIFLILTMVSLLPLICIRINQEEKILKENLRGYVGYAKRVPMLVPRFASTFVCLIPPCFFAEHSVSVNVWALRMCRATTVLLLLLALYFLVPWLVILVFILMLSAAIFSVSRSPLVRMYSFILKKFGVLREEKVDVGAIRFAQGLGSGLLFSAMLLFYIFSHPFGGWILVSIVILSTAFGSLGQCFGAYIYLSMRRMYHHA
jgi:protein-S-isoprenylcysteine O-methyltransferase Ste14